MFNRHRLWVWVVGAGFVYNSVYLMARDVGKSRPVAHAIAAVGVVQLVLLVAAVRVGRFLLKRHRGPRQTVPGPEADYDDAPPAR